MIPHLFLLYLFQNVHKCEAILQTAAIDVRYPEGHSLTMLASQASFGPNPAMSAENNPSMVPAIPPENDPLLCNEALNLIAYSSIENNVYPSGTVLLVPRGECSFERKTLAAQRLGASAVLIYGTLASRYSLNATTGETIYPTTRADYDCDRASAFVSSAALSFSPPPYNARIDDAVLSGTAADGNLCAVGNDRFEERCPSARCLVTGGEGEVEEGPEGTVRACCAWDLPIWLYGDPEVRDSPDAEPIVIPAFYLTMVQADIFFQGRDEISNFAVTMYSRYSPDYNLSAMLIWGLGVVIAALAAYLSASDYRSARKELEATRTDRGVDTLTTEPAGEEPSSKIRNRSLSPGDRTGLDNDDDNQRQQSSRDVCRNGYEPLGAATAYQRNEETLELTMTHAIGFSFVSGAGLLTLFYLKIYSFVKVMYTFSCCNAMMVVIFMPLYMRIFRRLNIRDRDAFTTATCDIGTITYAGLLAAITSYTIGAVWIFISFTVPHPDQVTFFWIVQDIMGACVCITFLAVIKLNSIKVATMLLVAGFFYDIFFVFITPYLTKGGKSIMIDVATSGGPPKADPQFCEKYPSDADCQGGDPLPMLLTIPRLFDFHGGSSLLGLGDIVLPGLLLSFGARYDEAKRYIGALRGNGAGGMGGRELCAESKGGYFVPLVISYAVGLSMANAAVYLMQMGQPALLYLVPCCLGTVCFLGWRRNELAGMWKTPNVFVTCDQLLYGELAEGGDDINNTGGGGEGEEINSSVPNGNALT